jgi:hypothetical protein
MALAANAAGALALVRSLRKKRSEDLFHLTALALGTLGAAVAMLRERLDLVEHMVALTTAVFVGRHMGLHIPTLSQR